MISPSAQAELDEIIRLVEDPTATWTCASPSGDLRLARYRIGLEATSALDLPSYLGSTLRGAFGHVFRRIACLAPQGGRCPAPDAAALRNLDDIPRPFVIAPAPAARRAYHAGDEVAFDLTLIGRAREFFPHFVVTLREMRLALFHCGVRLDLDFVDLIERAKAVRLIEDRARWEDWVRYSSRQDRRMTLGGLVGEAVYEGPLDGLWPFLVFGQWTHVGKNATFGLGRYEIVGSPQEGA